MIKAYKTLLHPVAPQLLGCILCAMILLLIYYDNGYALSVRGDQIYFGNIEYVPSHKRCTIRLDAASGRLTCNNPALFCPDFGRPAHFRVTGVMDGAPVQVSCASHLTVHGHGNQSFSLERLHVFWQNRRYHCRGLSNPVMEINLPAGQQDLTMQVGGNLVFNLRPDLNRRLAMEIPQSFLLVSQQDNYPDEW